MPKESWECRACAYESGEIIPLLNEQYYNLTLEAINSANSSIYIVMYEMKFYNSNNSVKTLENALVNARKRGVEIRIILDVSEWYGAETELSKENKRSAEFLSNAGIEIKMDSPKLTTHDKLIIIDNSTVIVGSHNWSHSAMTKNNEASVMIIDRKIAMAYLEYFEWAWKN